MPRTTTKLSARERILAAANELFYREGVQTVGIDRIIEHAGVAKASSTTPSAARKSSSAPTSNAAVPASTSAPPGP
ncbi:TetR/AcrR family transcriptional regulator [Streptosporangium lutulentum]